ncbi:hypothetical protein EDC01DRAFT_651407 [Geopyxis carbonaria]|nr:hypothetical protein EDC01DRAFT_651407 [Geopyxis carbonaria]
MSEQRWFFGKFKDLLNSQEYSDLTIICDGQRFAAHQCIIGLRTPFFRAAVKESEFNTVMIHEHGAWDVILFLEWCYTGDYGYSGIDGNYIDEKEDTRAAEHLNLYMLADMLNVDDLKSKVVKCVKKRLAEKWTEEVSDFADLVASVYENTLETNIHNIQLRTLIMNTAYMHGAELVTISRYKIVLAKYGEFSAELVTRFLSHQAPSADLCRDFPEPGPADLEDDRSIVD